MLFIVEGLRMFREVPRDRLVKTYVSENFLEDPEHEALLQGIPYEVVKDSVFAQMSDTLTPQGGTHGCATVSLYYGGTDG